MATVVRRRALVNPARRRNARRRKMSPKQIRFFGTPAQKAALRRSRAAKRTNRSGFMKHYRRAMKKGYSPQLGYKAQSTISRQAGKTWSIPARRRKNSAHRKRTRRARRNVSAIVTAGLPFSNPAPRRKKRTKMAQRTHSRRRHSTASHRPRRRRNRVMHHRRHRRRTNPFPLAVRRRTRRHMNRRRHHSRRRHNPSTRGATGALMKGAFVLGGAIGSRWLTQLALGSANTGYVGYAANGVATWILGWASGKFLGRGSSTYVYIGGAAGVILRVLQDQGIIGKIPGLMGLGDPGVGALLPSQYLDPPLYTNVTSAQRVFPYALPAPAGMKGMGVVGTYSRGASTYGRRF